MLVLLPPSEGKAAAGSGPRLDLGALSLPELTSEREAVVDALITLCGTPEKASDVLGLGPTQAAEIEANVQLRTAPTLPASRLFTGVLFDHLDLASLTPTARRRAADYFLVFSGLFGALRLDDHVPPHRLSMGVTLPGIGGLASFWRRALTPTLDVLAEDQLVVDLRSTPYTNAWKPPADRTVVVRVVTPDGRTVSHFNKATKGLVARALIKSRSNPTTPKRLRTVIEAAGLPVRLLDGAPATLEVTAV